MQDFLWLVEEQKDVQGERPGGKLAAQLLESHSLLFSAEAADHLHSVSDNLDSYFGQTHTSTMAWAAAPTFPFMFSSSPISFWALSTSCRHDCRRMSLE